MQTHRPCFLLSICLGLGIIAGRFLPCPDSLWMTFFATSFLMVFLDRRAFVVFIATFFLGALLWVCTTRLPFDHLAFLSYDERTACSHVEGVVDSMPQVGMWVQGTQQIFDLKVERILINEEWQRKVGKMQVHIFQKTDLHYGQRIRISGKIHQAFDGKEGDKFSYRKYLRDQGIFWVLSAGKNDSIEPLDEGAGNPFVSAAIKTKNRIKDVFKRYLNPQEAGVITAMVLGDRSNMPKDIKQAFIDSGTFHILAISGMNMTIIAGLVLFLFKYLGLRRRGQFIATVLFLFAYAFLTGWSASVVRACVMSSVILSSFAFEYDTEPLNSFGLAALLLLFSDARNLFDIGFQLSFGAVLAILLLYAHFEKALRLLPSFIAKTLAVSAAAWVGTAGILWYHFGSVNFISLVANIPIVPLADMVIILGLGLAITGLFVPFLALAFAGALKALFALVVILAGWFAQVPYGHIST